jgi:6-phosphogluconolactonase (cycloisomerase 2 family)
VANRGLNSVSVYSIDAETGALKDTVLGSPFGGLNTPIFTTVAPGCKFAYVANSGNKSITGYKIDAAGALSPMTPSASPTFFGTGTTPTSIAIAE